jgi:hypothetical protein
VPTCPEYRLIKEKGGRLDLLLAGDATGTLSLDFVRMPRQRVSAGKFDLAKLEPMGATARGIRLARKAVRKIKWTRPPQPTGSSKATPAKKKRPDRQPSLF